MSKKLLLLIAALLLVLAACSSDDGGTVDAGDQTTTAAVDEGPAGPDDDMDDHGDDDVGDHGDDMDDDMDDHGDDDMGDDGPCPAETEVEVGNSDGLDGPIDPTTTFADVTFGSASIVIASYEIPEDPQFGISAPVGVPDVPEGGTIFQFDLFPGVDEDELLVGTYLDDDDAEPRITFISMYHGDERILPLGDHTVEVTEITDEHICGVITGVTDPNDFQSFPVVTGRFIVDAV